MIPAAFDYRRPTSLAEAVRLLAAHADDAKDHGLVAEAVERAEIEVGLGPSIEICSTRAPTSSGRNV